MLQKTVKIGEKEVAFRSSATIPRLYRIKFKRDIFKDLSKLEQSYKGKTSEGGSFEIEDLEIFENVAYIMAFHADHTIPDNIDDWLDQFEMFSIYEVLPEILELWGTNLITDVQSKKNLTAEPGNDNALIPPALYGNRHRHCRPRPSDYRSCDGYVDRKRQRQCQVQQYGHRRAGGIR